MRAAILVVLTSTTWLTACDDRGGIAIEDDSTTHVARPPPALVINEVVAANATGLTDEVGAHPDWIELYNPTSEEVSLAGWRLVNDLDQAGTLHPSLTLPAGETLVFFADNDPEEGPNHLQLRLDVNGEWLGLVYLDEVVDSVEWGPLIPDVALARSPDGYPDWVISTAPTPDALNGGTQVPENPATLDCLPSVTLGEPFIVEGQATTASASCPADSFDTGWVTPGGDLNGNEWSWTPDVDQAGEHAVLFWAKQTGTTGVPETATANIGVADAWSNPANITVDPETYSREWGLPVLHLAPSAPPSQNYQPAPAWFDGVQYQGQMKIRGAASAGYPKNNYTLEFDPIQIDLGSVGLQNKDHLVLISNFDDNSYTRQALVYAVWDRMATNFGEVRMVPRTFPVVVYVNGSYLGLFLGIDHIDDEFIREMGFVDGGNLYKSVSHDANFYLKNPLSAGWEKKEGLPLTDFTDIEQLTQWAGSSNHTDFATEVDSQLFTEEFMDWFLLVHHLAADDSAGKNAYLYAAPGEGRFHYAPWDFNHALGQTWQTARQSATQWNDFTGNNALFWHFQEEPTLAAELQARYHSHLAIGGALNGTVMEEMLDQMYVEIGPNAARDWDKWESEYRSYGGWSWRSDFTTSDEEREYLYDWIAERDAQ